VYAEGEAVIRRGLEAVGILADSCSVYYYMSLEYLAAHPEKAHNIHMVM
jgi:hypothetical protein